MGSREARRDALEEAQAADVDEEDTEKGSGNDAGVSQDLQGGGVWESGGGEVTLPPPLLSHGAIKARVALRKRDGDGRAKERKSEGELYAVHHMRCRGHEAAPRRKHTRQE